MAWEWSQDLSYYPLTSMTNISPSFSSCSAPLQRPQPVVNTPLRRAEKERGKRLSSSSSRWHLMQNWCNWETSSNRGTMRSVSHKPCVAIYHSWVVHCWASNSLICCTTYLYMSFSFVSYTVGREIWLHNCMCEVCNPSLYTAST